MADNLRHPYNRRRALTIDDLTDDLLIEIFDSYVVSYHDLGYRRLDAHVTKTKIESWQTLVHVCQRWRGLVFASARRLDLQLVYVPERMAGLDVWPALPLHVFSSRTDGSVNNVIARLEHRICQINLDGCTIRQTWTAMQVPFPELAGLSLSRFRFEKEPKLPSLPDSFLGGSAPRLRCFYLDAIPFPGLPKLLETATHLVELSLSRISDAGYISPEEMVTCLSVSTSLESLQLEFEPHLQYPDFKSEPSLVPNRLVFPTLSSFRFRGVNTYLEEFLARIDAPQLYRLSTTFFLYFGFKVADLDEFISRTPTLGAYEEAHLTFDESKSLIRLRRSHRGPEPSDRGMVEVDFSTKNPVQRFSSLVQTCTLSLPLLLTMESLYIDGDQDSASVWNDHAGNTDWLDLLALFPSVKNLYLSKTFSTCIALVLHGLNSVRRSSEVLPALQIILLEGYQRSDPVEKGILRFVAARQLTDHPVVISGWPRESLDISSERVVGNCTFVPFPYPHPPAWL